MSKYIIKNCLQCQVEFNAAVRDINRGYGKFCSRSCRATFSAAIVKVKIPNCSCAMCKTDFYITNKRRNSSKSGLFFCSRKCKNTAQRLNSGVRCLPDHYGKGNSCRSYRQKAFAHYPNQCNKCGWDRYPKILEVHHMDRNRENNKLENLEILCATCHEETHYLAKDGKYSKNKKSKKLVENLGNAPN